MTIGSNSIYDIFNQFAESKDQAKGRRRAEEFTVKKILAMTFRHGLCKPFFLIEWNESDRSQSTWEPYYSLDCVEKLAEFFALRTLVTTFDIDNKIKSIFVELKKCISIPRIISESSNSEDPTTKFPEKEHSEFDPEAGINNLIIISDSDNVKSILII